MYLYRIFIGLMLSGSIGNIGFAGTLSSGALTIVPQRDGALTSANMNPPTVHSPSDGNISVSGGNVTVSGGSSSPSGGNSEITPSNEYSIFVDGNLFLDYSVFGDDQGINIANDVSIKAEETVGIFSFDEEPKMPDLSTTTIILDPSLSINEISDTLIFSEFPITNGTFEATIPFAFKNVAFRVRRFL